MRPLGTKISQAPGIGPERRNREGDTMSDTLERVKKVLQEGFEVDPAKVTPESTLASLGLDSLDTVEVVMQCEDEFGIEIDQESNPSTVGEFVTVIDNTLGE